MAKELDKVASLTILSGKPLPAGWTGKLWAMDQGFRHLQQQPPDYVLFTDADIEHDGLSVQQLVTKAEANKLDLVSLMVRLRCETFWEVLLIPAFVFFFQMLYPFPWVNDSRKKIAAAAGGCVLLRFSELERINGLQTIRHALIDDCALGAAVKAEGAIWLGLSTTTLSLRPYPDLQSIWTMVARSAYTQLNYSPWLLVGTVLGMILVYMVSPLGVVLGLMWGQPVLVLAGLAGWLLMAMAYWPTLRLYEGSALLALALPGIAVLYTLMTLDSARRHWVGQGGAWKGRVYRNRRSTSQAKPGNMGEVNESPGKSVPSSCKSPD
jgi:hopene-associated glycosyltransferase HpnB